jgi:hypothetical protein
MAELHCDLREEQRAHSKIRGLFGNCASEIKPDLDLVYVPYRRITSWVSILKEGRTNVKDDHGFRRQITLPLKKNISTVKAKVDKHA